MNNSSDMNIAKALDIDLSPVKEDVKPAEIVKPEPSGLSNYRNDDADKDYEEVRKNLKVVIEQSNSAVQGILELAEDSQQPRAYEVVAQLIGQTLEANTKLIDLHRRMKDIKKQDVIKQTNNVTNNSIFVGSTSELQKMLREQRKLIDNEANKDKP